MRSSSSRRSITRSRSWPQIEVVVRIKHLDHCPVRQGLGSALSDSLSSLRAYTRDDARGGIVEWKLATGWPSSASTLLFVSPSDPFLSVHLRGSRTTSRFVVVGQFRRTPRPDWDPDPPAALKRKSCDRIFRVCGLLDSIPQIDVAILRADRVSRLSEEHAQSLGDSKLVTGRRATSSSLNYIESPEAPSSPVRLTKTSSASAKETPGA